MTAPRSSFRVPLAAALWAGLLLAGCRTPAGPEHALQAYARALEENRLDEAYALTSSDTRERVTPDAFSARYENPQARVARARVVADAAASLKVCGLDVEAVRDGDRWLVRELPSDDGARQALLQFLDASERGDFPAAYRLLSGAWRSRYTPERLAKDFALEPLAKERLARARAALSGPVVLEDGVATFPIGEGRAVRLVREGGLYRVSALE
jgi:hypothetical protein